MAERKDCCRDMMPHVFSFRQQIAVCFNRSDENVPLGLNPFSAQQVEVITLTLTINVINVNIAIYY
jgi:hypothetical protein